ncbi:hypothetical protein L7F22_062583 [Adiantum nelumboides]|nr:hypothetical protein [Adiantum nelumboides]
MRSHIGITTILLPPPSSDPACRPFLADYARAIAGCLQARGAEAPAAGHFMKLSIRLPISSPYNLAETMLRNPASLPSSGSSGSVSPAQLRSDDDWSWQTWRVIEGVCQYSSRLSVSLDLSAPLPMSFALQRWTSEPVSHVWLPSRAFLSNAKGYPVLSKASQSLLRALITVKSPLLSIIIVGSQNPPSQHSRGGQAAYEQYVRHLEKAALAQSAMEAQTSGYADYLQAPLQPLFDNLEAQTYATFEADETKYIQYEEAIYQALLTRSRGAAVREWGEDVVEVRVGDMRKIKPPRESDRVDIVVSELLGSFGDNELSPECLDGAMRFLKREWACGNGSAALGCKRLPSVSAADGISIPRAYTSYLTPISTPKLHSEVLSGNPIASSSGGAQSVAHQTKATETPYVVLLKAFTNLAANGGRGDWAEVQDCWTFEHANEGQVAIALDDDELPLTNSHNVRASTLTFHIPHAGVCHGLGGYFEAHLFGSVTLSIHPDPARATREMMSWFPIFFPFKEPIHLAANSELDVHMWRLSCNKRVWYEWMAQAYICIPKAFSPSPVLAGGHAGGQRNASGNSDGPMDAAFQNAPLTPRFAEVGLGMPGHSAANPSLLAVAGEEMSRSRAAGVARAGCGWTLPAERRDR